jgi:hypothetical protein
VEKRQRVRKTEEAAATSLLRRRDLKLLKRSTDACGARPSREKAVVDGDEREAWWW